MSQPMELVIGKSGTRAFKLPADVQAQTVAVLGIRGSGKSHTSTVIAEELLESGHQVVIIDPTDVWWGLKSSRDGKKAGYPIIVLGGPHGDLPLSETDGALIADFLVEHAASAVISLRHLRKKGQRRFVTEFSEQLYHRKGELQYRTSIMVMIDECDAFVPQKVLGEEARCVGAIEDLVRRGRNVGIGVVLISQRAACINKDVLTQLELLVAHRHTSPQDRKALQEWIRAHDTADREAEFMAALASLPRGQAYFWSPGWLDVFQLVAVRERRTYDSSATPKPGQAATAPKAVAEVDLEALKGSLARTIQEHEENDPRKLRARIAELERTAAEAPAQPVSQETIDALVNQHLSLYRAHLARVDIALDRLKAGLERVAADGCVSIDELKDAAIALLPHAGFGEVLVDRGTMIVNSAGPVRTGQPVHWEADGTVSATPRRRTAPQVDGSSIIGKCERMILTVLAQYPQGRSHVQTAILSGYSHTSGGYKNSLSKLRTAGHINGGGENMRITASGRTALGPVDPLPRGQALVAYWCSRLGKCERSILESLVRLYPKSHSHQSLASATGYEPTSGGFKNALSKLRTLELITRGAEIRAYETLFA